MGPLVLIGKDLLVEATAQVVWFVKPSAVFSRSYWMIGGFGMMIIFRTRASQKTRKKLNLLIFVGDYEAFDGRRCTLPETIISTKNQWLDFQLRS